MGEHKELAIGRNRRGKARAVKAPAGSEMPDVSLHEVVSESRGRPVPVDSSLTEAEARRVDFAWSACMLGLIVLTFYLLSLFGGVSVPVLLALAMAYVLNPLVTLLERRGLNRTLGTSVVFVGCALLMVGGVLYLIPVFRDEAAKLPDFFRRASERVVPQVEALLGLPLPDLLRERMQELGARASEIIQSTGPAAARLVADFASNTARFLATLLGLLVVPVLGFFFLQDYPRLVEMAKSLVPRRATSLVSRRFSEVDEVLSAFVRGQLTVGAILSLLYGTGLWFARMDLAIVIGVIAGFGNMVPYLGTGVGVLLAALGLMLSWQGPWQILVVAGTFVVGQMAEGLVITPRVVGEKVGLAPVAVIIAVLAFGELFGFTGILLAVPTSAILKVVLRVVVARYQKMEFYTGG